MSELRENAPQSTDQYVFGNDIRSSRNNVRTSLCDDIHKPSHYQLEDGTQVKAHITSLTAHMSGVRAWATGNAIKYLARAGRKDDMVKDLKKAQENIQIIIDDIEKRGYDK